MLPGLSRRLALLEPKERLRIIRKMSPADLLRYDADFESWAHEGQRPPSGSGWRTWLMMAGRGYGKTRAGAEWITRLATGTRRVRIALVGATADEVRKVMIEGESGLLAVGALNGRRPDWEPALGRLTWRGGSQAFVYSAENPDGLRGPAHHFAWCDELAKWRNAEAAWDNLQLGLRCGERPRALVTTTPRQAPILRKIAEGPRAVKTTGRTTDNGHLPEEFVQAMAETYGGTRFGRQELDGELIADKDGALWTRDGIEAARVDLPVMMRADPATRSAIADSGLLRCARNDGMTRVVLGVDPPASAGGTCGIVACGVDSNGGGYVLGDHSVSGMRPEGWARRVADAAESWAADIVVVETNQGGDMVESVLRNVDCGLPVQPVHARFGKAQRAGPVALLFERGKAKFAGAFPEMEDELCGLIQGGGYEGPGKSPDRADAMVWAMTELMLRKKAEPGVRAL